MSDAEIHFIQALTTILNTTRPAGAPELVIDKNGSSHTLSIISESSTDPRERPCLILIADGGNNPHPFIRNFELRLENLYAVDDFDELTVSTWQSAVATYLNDYESVCSDTWTHLENLESPWRLKKMVPSTGGSDTDGQRSRGIVDRWLVWLIK